MPKINLRLTEEEHAALKAWAQSSHRSLQREAVYRLFAHRVDATKIQPGAVLPERDTDVERVASPRPSLPRSESIDDHFKPDFKKGQK